jgi:hypothetical protein
MSQAADKAILTCALTGVLTNPQQHPVPVTPAQMAAEARDAFNAGASIMHVHLRSQEPGFGHMPSWDPDVAQAVCRRHPRRLPGRHHQPHHRRHRQGHQRPRGLPAARAARDRGLQRRQR